MGRKCQDDLRRIRCSAPALPSFVGLVQTPVGRPCDTTTAEGAAQRSEARIDMAGLLQIRPCAHQVPLFAMMLSRHMSSLAEAKTQIPAHPLSTNALCSTSPLALSWSRRPDPLEETTQSFIAIWSRASMAHCKGTTLFVKACACGGWAYSSLGGLP